VQGVGTGNHKVQSEGLGLILHKLTNHLLTTDSQVFHNLSSKLLNTKGSSPGWAPKAYRRSKYSINIRDIREF